MDKKVYEYYTKLRDLRGLKDAQVATLAGIGKGTFSDWKAGRCAPKQEKLNKIANALGVAPEYFINGNETGKDPCPPIGQRFEPVTAQKLETGSNPL